MKVVQRDHLPHPQPHHRYPAHRRGHAAPVGCAGHAAPGRPAHHGAAAVEGSSALDAQEIAAVIDPLRRAVDALRTGAASFDDWLRLASVVNIANAIERQGVVRGMASELAKCEAAVQAIGDRTGDTHATWKSPTLYAAEIVATSDLVHWHKFQLEQLSYKEYAQARDYAVAKVRSSGGRAFNVKGMKS